MIIQSNSSEIESLAYVMALCRKDLKKQWKKSDRRYLKTYDSILSDLTGYLEVFHKQDTITPINIKMTKEQARMSLNFIKWYFSNNISNKTIETDFYNLKKKIEYVLYISHEALYYG